MSEWEKNLDVTLLNNKEKYFKIAEKRIKAAGFAAHRQDTVHGIRKGLCESVLAGGQKREELPEVAESDERGCRIHICDNYQKA